jgi:hypothetical protein
MGIETATFIASLNLGWPLGLDTVSQGDDHLRLIKKVLKATFPGAGGQGLASAINVTETEFNYLAGVTSPLQTQLTNNAFPIGTVLPFHQAAPPPFWTLVNVHDFMLRVVNTGGGGSGGTDSPILMAVVPSHTHGLSGISLGYDGAHSHYIPMAFTPLIFGTSDINVFGLAQAGSTYTDSAGGHTHTVSGGTIAANAGADTWSPKYKNVILCSKS